MGGPGPLLSRTRDQLNRLAQQLAFNAAWPVGLIHGDKGSPTDQHQVLAIGYRQSENKNTLVLNIWDNNWDNLPHPSCRVLAVDLSGGELMVYSNDQDLNDIKGIICENYSPSVPTASLYTPWKPGTPVRWSPGDCS
jgi:hypothetical protein